MEFQNTPEPKRILVIRRNRMGDMLCAVPLLHALRRRFPEAHIAVACDQEGAAVAQACAAVDRVRVLDRGLFGTAMNALRLRGYDAVIAVKGGYDKRLASLTRLTDAPIRIGFHPAGGKKRSPHYTHQLPPPSGWDEHQIDTCLRLLDPLGVTDRAIDLSLRLPDEATAFAQAILKKRRTGEHRRVVIINISSNRPLPLTLPQLAVLIRRLVNEGSLVAISAMPSKAEQARAMDLAKQVNSSSVFVLEMPNVLHLCAMIKESSLVFTPEGGMGHLAAAMGTPALVLWSEGPFEKWKTWAANHRYLRLDQRKEPVTIDELWQAIHEM